jgi:hypothetical protein
MPVESRGDFVDPTLAQLERQRQNWKYASKRMGDERDSWKEKAELAAREIADLKSRPDPATLARQIESLQAELRLVKHREAYNRLARVQKAPDDALAALWQLSGWKAETDDVDEAKMAATIEAQRKDPAQMRLFGAGVVPTPVGPPGSDLVPGPATGRGNNVPAPLEAFNLQENDPRWNDVRWQFENFDKIAAAAKERVDRGQV